MDNIYDYNKLHTKFSKLVSLLIIAVLTFLIFYFISNAWFGYGESANKVFVVGDIKLDVSSNLTFSDDYIQPNKIYDDMSTVIKCKEDADEAYIKVKYTTTYKVNDKDVVFPILYNSQENIDEGSESWIYSDADDCYYYVGYVSATQSAIFNTALQVSNEITNKDIDKEVKITITVYGIQRANLAYKNEQNWKDAPSDWLDAIRKYDIYA